MDFSKAFDKISHYGLFLKLIRRNVPLCFLMTIMYYYLNMSCKCKWGDCFSDYFGVTSGTKQGGILSPDFFALYIDKLIQLLKDAKVGCHIMNIFISCILFADDLTLLSPTRSSMQRMIQICSRFCSQNCLIMNPAKTKTVLFGKKVHERYDPLFINDSSIDYVPTWKYLGTTIQSGDSFSFSAKSDIRSFYRAFNSIYSTLSDADEIVLMKLLYTNCVSILTYASAVKEFSNSDKSDCHVAVNHAIRKIFSFKRYASIRFLREFFHYKSLTDIFAIAEKRFLTSLVSSNNVILLHLINL